MLLDEAFGAGEQGTHMVSPSSRRTEAKQTTRMMRRTRSVCPASCDAASLQETVGIGVLPPVVDVPRES